MDYIITILQTEKFEQVQIMLDGDETTPADVQNMLADDLGINIDDQALFDLIIREECVGTHTATNSLVNITMLEV
ncbi:hypothetical protein [Providencia phage PSTCR5]|uniref:Uncharacterized protein n=1 Tax=Providencia phage PSTCR5 TaxID=2783547 RepID=A0A873WHV8_9CAUD|nr:hypothetical protein KNV68_gp128 [Providencia phage PSTCR5]QPB12230.1 hypothetical protein [Providencia phage PSTCR5]